MKLFFLTNAGFSGDNNQVIGIQRAAEAKLNIEMSVSRSEDKLDLSEIQPGDSVLIAGSHGLDLVAALKNRGAFVVWSGHQYFDAINHLQLWPDIMALPKGSCSLEQEQVIAAHSTLVQTDGVAHNLSQATVKEDFSKIVGFKHPSIYHTHRVAIVLAGDAPRPDEKKTMQCFTPSDATQSAREIVDYLHLKEFVHEKTFLMVTNGPRTGKHNPETTLPYDPDPHRSGVRDASFEAFLAVLEEAFPGQVNFYDFQHGHTSAFKPMLGILSDSSPKRSMCILPTESISMVTEGGSYLGQFGIPVVVYKPSSANETHMAVVEEARARGLVCHLGETWVSSARCPIVLAADQIAQVMKEKLMQEVSSSYDPRLFVAGKGFEDEASRRPDGLLSPNGGVTG